MAWHASHTAKGCWCHKTNDVNIHHNKAVDIELKRWEKVGLDYQNNDRDNAMDIDIPQNEREGFTQAREAKDFTKARLMESKVSVQNRNVDVSVCLCLRVHSFSLGRMSSSHPTLA